MSASPPYRVKSVEAVMNGIDISIRRLTLAPGEEVPWHRHTSTKDLCVLLPGSLRVEAGEPVIERVLTRGYPSDARRNGASAFQCLQ